MFAHDLLFAGSIDIIVAGGMESMTNAPYLLPKARAGLRMGHGQVIDHMFYDGLEDAYDKGRLMGTFAEDCAPKYRFSREKRRTSSPSPRCKRAQKANKEGWFAWETDAARHQGRQGREVHRDRRAAVQGQPGEDPDAQARVPQGRHRHRGELELDLRRRGGAGDDAPLDRREARPRAARRGGRARDARAGAGLVHHRAGRRDPQAVREDRLDGAAASTCTRSTRPSPW